MLLLHCERATRTTLLARGTDLKVAGGTVLSWCTEDDAGTANHPAAV
jgi:hypothetical protein